MIKVEFTKDFANKKKGDTGNYDSQLASQLVNVDGVAIYHKEKKEPKK